MKKIIISSIAVLLLFGCSSKKKITSYNKGYEATYAEAKKEGKTEEVKTSKEKTDVQETTEEQNDITTVMDIIFGDDGRPTSARITRTDKSKRNSGKSGSSSKSDSTATNTATNEVDISASETETEVESKDIEKKQTNPIWQWIGFGLLICIVGFFVWKVILKR